MGNSDSRPAFDFEAQLLADTSKPQTVAVEDPTTASPTATLPRRSHVAEKGLITVPYASENGGYPTIWDCFLRGVRKFPKNRCLGTRVYELQSGDATKVQRDPKDKSIVRGAYMWETYEEISEAARDFGAGLVALGAQPRQNIGIFSANRTEWVVSSLGMYSQNLRVVALYASLGENAVEYIINNGDVGIVCVSKKEMPNLLKALPKTKGVTHIIQFDHDARYQNVEDVVAPADIEACQALGVKLLGFSEVKKMGHDQSQAIFPNPAKAEDVAYIMYTSGTTGSPKGVILTHQNICATVSAVPFVVTLTETDQFLSFLPLAHIFETVVEVAFMAVGASIGFFQDNIKKLTLDMQDVKPTVLCGVPRVFQRIYQVVFAGVAEKNCVVRWYFNRAYQAQADAIHAGRPTSKKYDQKVFKALRERIGLANVRVFVSGAAPMPPYVGDFLRIIGNCPYVEGYGMTEATAATSVASMGDRNLTHTGPILPCAEVRLVDIPDMGYLSTDKHPRGEICVRGPAVFSGYYKDPENTASMLINGWLHTGDVGRFNPNGTLSIIDRKKNMLKLSQGEYIAIEKVEQVYGQSSAVGQLWVYGNSFKSFVLAVVVPSPEPTAAWLFSKGWWPRADKESTRLAVETFPADFHKAVSDHSADVKTWVIGQLRELEKPLTSFSRIRDIIIESDIDRLGMAFTEANDCLTPTFKTRRPQLLQRYLPQLKALYAANGEDGAEKWPGEK